MRAIELEAFLSGSTDGHEESYQLARQLEAASVVAVHDPRVSWDDNAGYLDMMERYFAQDDEVIARDERPDLHYQVGVSRWEQPRDHRAYISTMPYESWPHLTPRKYEGDPRWRFFRRLGQAPEETAFPRLNAPEVIPEGFEVEWASTMDAWGNKLLGAVYTIAEMLAQAYDLPLDTFTKGFARAPHLIAPNGVKLYGHKVGTVFNGFHTDLNWGTIHGQSRWPGLRIWPRDDQPFRPKVPHGCLLFQVGKQLEWQTGGHLLAGFHEVAMLPETVTALEGRPTWPPIRVSSTVFAHQASDLELGVLPHFLRRLGDDAEREQVTMMYPTMLTGHQVEEELEAIGFKKK